MKIRNQTLSRTSLATALSLALGQMAWSAPLSLATVPQGNGGRGPAPNLIISVDDSGSMGWSGITALKNALTTSFGPAAVADDSIRLGFQAMCRCRGLSNSPAATYGGTCPDTRVKRFSGTHRTNFNNWVNSLDANCMTPSHAMQGHVHSYMTTAAGVDSPFASNPGIQETPLLSCRRTFHIFMTDGGWNSEWFDVDPRIGNQDGTSVTLPDGTLYSTDAAETQTRVYRDTMGGDPAVNNSYSTLADFTFRMWATDYSPLADEVKPIVRVPGVYNAGSNGNPYNIQPYWNPKNNPMTWQGVTTYTIGFNAAAAMSTNGGQNRPWWGGSTWTGADYDRLLTGAVTWGDPNSNWDARIKELWHMAINGRGKMVPATSPAELSAAFAEIINQVVADSQDPITSIAMNTQTSRSDTKAFVAEYKALKWSGDVKAYALTSTGTVSSTVSWSAASVLDGANFHTRRVVTHNGTAPATFAWNDLSDEQKLLLQNGGTVAEGRNRLDYLKGERTNEVANGGTLRDRDNRMGDIVNSVPWPIGKPNMGYLDSSYRTFRTNNAGRIPMVYVGANDGMLHGFSQIDGSEKIAYVPKGLYYTLPNLTNTGYAHRYYVDGKPFAGDYFNGSAWRTALVGTLAGGGKGYFILDVTDPSQFNARQPDEIVMVDNTDASPKTLPTGVVDTFDPDIGHMYGPPVVDSANSAKVVQMAKLNNGRWAVLMGNGVNSTDEKPVLLIQYLDGNKELLKIYANSTVGGGNGLAHPQVIDLDSDGKIDIAYAGDLQGNLWKFDLRSALSTNWNVAFSGTPLYVALDSTGARQPITTAPAWTYNSVGGINLTFGTGRDMTTSDPTSTSQQTMYSVWDNTAIDKTTSPVTFTGGSAITAANSRSVLVQRTQTGTVSSTAGTFYKTSDTTAVTYTGANAKRGWYFDMPVVGERTISNSYVFDKRLALVPSVKPTVGSTSTTTATESCDPQPSAGENYITILDSISGKPYKFPLFDNDGGGFTGSETSGLSRMKTGADPATIVSAKGSSKPYESRSSIVSARPGATSSTGLRVFDDPAKVGWRHLQ